jgi:hypothetical protein
VTNFALMTQRVRTLTNGHVSDSDIKELINRIHQEEVESGQWHYRQTRTHLTSGTIKADGLVSIAQGDTTVFGAGTTFGLDDIGKYMRIGGGTNETIPIPVTDVQVFPEAIGFESLTVTSTAVSTIRTAYNGIQGTDATITVLGGNIRYTFDGTIPTPTVGHLLLDGSQFTVSGHINLDNLRLIAENVSVAVTVTVERTTEELELEFPWPHLSVIDTGYELFPRYYALPINCDDIMRVNQVDYLLKEWTQFELDFADPNRRERSDLATRWSRAGVNDDGQKLIELWPITSESRHYVVEYLAGHVPLVVDSDRPLVPPTLLESRALQDASLVMYARTGDERWQNLADKHEKNYEKAKEALRAADTRRFGQLEHILDLDGLGYGVGYRDYSYVVDHDTGYL